MFTEDLSIFLRDFGVPVVYGVIETVAIYDCPDQEVLGGQAVSTQHSITYESSKLPGLTHEDALTLTINGVPTAFVVSGYPQLLDDGAFSLANLAKV